LILIFEGSLSQFQTFTMISVTLDERTKITTRKRAHCKGLEFSKMKSKKQNHLDYYI